MIHLRALSRNPGFGETNRFPFTVPVIRALTELEFSSPVTFFVGENGSGKSTLLEGIACAVGSITVGSENVSTDKTLDAVRQLSRTLKLQWGIKTKKGFFLRAEDFFGYAKRMAQMRAEYETDLQGIDREYQGRSQLAVDLAKLPYERELQDLKQRYGEGLDTHSHGESFLELFQARFVPGGLYLLDEPEAPLSPLRQLGLVALLKQMVAENAQFIIATHSPIIMAYPEALIYNFDGDAIRQIAYEDVEHVALTRAFLNDREAYLRHL